MTPEAKVLARVKKTAKALGLRFVRLSQAPGVEAGWPDAFVLGPHGCVLWVETKAPGKPLRPIQKERARTLKSYDHQWCKPDAAEAVDAALKDFSEYCEDMGSLLCSYDQGGR